MSCGGWKRIRQRLGLRLTLWYSGIFIVSTLLLFGVAYFMLSASLERRDQRAIQVRLKELSVLYRAGGLEVLERESHLLRGPSSPGPFVIRLADPYNRTVFLFVPPQWGQFDPGRLERAPIETNGVWLRVPFDAEGHFLEVGSVHLSRDYVLQAGRSNAERNEILRHFRQVFTLTVIPLLLLGFIGGIFLAFRALNPVRSLIGTIRSIESGNMRARVPDPGTGDELDELITLFNAMMARIETLMQALRDALDNVAHDLRTPMTRLRGMAEVALQSPADPQAYREALADCLEESERMLRMLNTLMDISEAETGVIRLDLQAVDLEALLRDTVALYADVAEQKHITIALDVRPTAPVAADPVRLRQILANLFDNAVKYTHAGGHIEVKTWGQGREAFIEVGDDGIGITAEELPRIWERLYRGDRSRSQKGLGLGLSLVKAIVAAHGGVVTASSRPGQGAVFTLRLPAADADPASQTAKMGGWAKTQPAGGVEKRPGYKARKSTGARPG